MASKHRLGVYSIHEKRVLIEPLFIDIDFASDGNLIIEPFNDDSTVRTNIVIDRAGNQFFDSEYFSIRERGEMYEVSVREERGEQFRILSGLVDKTGRVIVPCEYEDFSYSHDSFIYKEKETGKYGLRSLDGTEIIPAVYDSLRWAYGIELLYASCGESANKKEGLLLRNGAEVLPIDFKNVNVRGNTIIANDERGGTVYRVSQKD